MDSKRTLGLVLAIVGLILLIVSLAADSIGVGDGGGFGMRQIGGSIVGAIVALVGFYLQRKPAKTA